MWGAAALNFRFGNISFLRNLNTRKEILFTVLDKPLVLENHQYSFARSGHCSVMNFVH
jgi:hypothetical protein